MCICYFNFRISIDISREDHGLGMANTRLLTIYLALGLVIAAGAVSPDVRAAEMTGVKETVADEDLERDRKVRAQVMGGIAEESTVIHFTILPSGDDPTIRETRVFVQRRGQQSICVNVNSDDVIARSYRSAQNDPFDPTIPSVIRADSSGHSGDLVGFNDNRVFIRPHSDSDLFTTDECFNVSGQRGCFVDGRPQCDTELDEDQELCVGQTVGFGGCGGTDHATLIDELKKLVVTNEEGPIETAVGPIVTEAGPVEALPEDVLDAPEISQVLDDNAPPPPTINEVVSTVQDIGGGEDLVEVPSILGLTVPAAEQVILDAGLRPGNFDPVSPEPADSAALFGIRQAHAQTSVDCTPENNKQVTSQTLDPNDLVARNTVMGGEFCVAAIDAPEPPSVAIFLSGLAVVLSIWFWMRRRRPSDVA